MHAHDWAGDPYSRGTWSFMRPARSTKPGRRYARRPGACTSPERTPRCTGPRSWTGRSRAATGSRRRSPRRAERRRSAFEVGLERGVVAEPAIAPLVVIGARDEAQPRRAEDVVQPPAAAVAGDPPPRPARLARAVAVERAEGVGEPQLRAGPARRRARPRPRSPPAPRAAARGRRARTTMTLPSGASRRGVLRSPHSTRGPSRAASPARTAASVRGLIAAVRRVGHVDRVQLDPGAARGERGLGPGHRQQPGQRLERLPCREQHAGPPRTRRRRAGSAASSVQADVAQPEHGARGPPQRQRSRGHLLQREHVRLALRRAPRPVRAAPRPDALRSR